MKQAVPIILILLAFLLGCTCLGIIIGDTSSSTPPDNVFYHYHGLFAAFAVLLAAFIGGWFVLEPTKIAQRESRELLRQEMEFLAFVIHQQACKIKSNTQGTVSIYSGEIRALQENLLHLNVPRAYLFGELCGDCAKNLYESLLDPIPKYAGDSADVSEIIKHSSGLRKSLECARPPNVSLRA